MFGELYYGDFIVLQMEEQVSVTLPMELPAMALVTLGNKICSSNTLWAGFDQLYKSTNLGSNGVLSGTMILETSPILLSLLPDTNCIYTTSGTTLWRTYDGGINWTVITGSINTSGSPLRASQ